MPNLQQLHRMKSRYGDTFSSSLRKADIDILLESFDPAKIEKAISIERLQTKSFSFPDFKASSYVDYFLKRKKASVVLLFIDITGFSTKFTNKTSEDLVKYLDKYYKLVIPIINTHGGEIEKIMGDGIICVFGEPFLDDDSSTLHNNADKCSRKIIRDLKDTEFAVKIGLHFGEIMYYQNPTEDYFEYTMIGNALTELFRLESVSKPNSINFYGSTYYDVLIQEQVKEFNEQTINQKTKNPASWIYRNPVSIELSGVKYKAMRYVEAV